MENKNQKRQSCKNSKCECSKAKECFCGDKQEHGFYVCENCGQKVYLNDGDVLMECPRCSCKCFTKE